MLTEEEKRKASIKSRYDDIREWAKTQKEGGNMSEKEYSAFTLKIDTAEQAEILAKNKEVFENLLSDYQDYSSKRLAAQKKFDDDRKALETGGASQEQIAELEYQREETYKAIDEEFASRNASFQAWMNSIANLSLEQLRAKLQEAKEALSQAEKSGVSGNQLAVARAKVNVAEKEVTKKQAEAASSPKRSIKEWQDLYKTLKDVNDVFEEVGNAIGGTVGEIISAAGSIASSTMQMIDGIVTLANNSSMGISETGKVASESVSNLEKASVILAIISAALQIAMKIASLFTKKSSYEEYQEAAEVYEAYISVLDKVIEKQLELAETLSGENAHAAYQDAINLYRTQMSAARSLGDQYLNSRARGEHSKGVQIVEGMSYAGWEQAAAALGMSIDQFKSVMGGRMTGLFTTLTDEQLVKLQKEAPIFWAQLGNETMGYANQIVEGVSNISEALTQELETMTGVSFEDFKNSFIDTLSDMDSSSKDFANNFEEYLRNAIFSSLITSQYQSRIEALYKKWAEYAKSESKITEEEAEALRKEAAQISEDMLAERDNIMATFGWSGSSGQQSDSGGFETMSQDTATELNGRFTALQYAGEVVAAQSKEQTAILGQVFNVNTQHLNIADEIRNSLINSYFDLVTIRDNTTNTVKRLDDTNKKLDMVYNVLRKVWK